MTAAWTIVMPGRPPLLNAERSKHWRRHRETTAQWRADAAVLARAQRIPRRLPAITVTSWPTYRTRRSWPDVAAWAPATKAVIDGLVDAKVIEHDGPAIVVRSTFEAPRLGPADALHVLIATDVSVAA